MNLASRFNPLYWQCACLCVNSGSYATDMGDEEDTDDEEEITEEEVATEAAEKHVAPNYGKIAKAVDDAQHNGVKIALPDVNIADIDFIPQVEDNSILYSLYAVNVVNYDLYERIVNGRPYSSLNDFINRIQPTTVQIIGMIKAGCFDNIEKKNRRAIMLSFLTSLAEKEYPVKDQLTTTHLKKAIANGFNLDKYQKEIKVYKFQQYLAKNKLDTTAISKRYLLDEESTLKFFHLFIEPQLSLPKGEFGYLPHHAMCVKASALSKVVKQLMEPLTNYLNSEEGRKAFAKFEQDKYVEELSNKYCKGSVAAWEMETMCFYHDNHELTNVNLQLYNAKDFYKLPEQPVGIPYTGKDGMEHMKYNTCALVGTVTNADNSKHIVSLSTVYGIVNVKFFRTQYTNFNQQLSKVDPKTGKKIVTDASWFKRGTKLIMFGYRNDNLFVSKIDYNDTYPRQVGLIENVNSDGTLSIRYKRNK